MCSQAEELKERIKQFAICLVSLFRLLPRTEEARVIGKQVLRSGTSVVQIIAWFAGRVRELSSLQK